MDDTSNTGIINSQQEIVDQVTPAVSQPQAVSVVPTGVNTPSVLPTGQNVVVSASQAPPTQFATVPISVPVVAPQPQPQPQPVQVTQIPQLAQPQQPVVPQVSISAPVTAQRMASVSQQAVQVQPAISPATPAVKVSPIQPIPITPRMPVRPIQLPIVQPIAKPEISTQAAVNQRVENIVPITAPLENNHVTETAPIINPLVQNDVSKIQQIESKEISKEPVDVVDGIVQSRDIVRSGGQAPAIQVKAEKLDKFELPKEHPLYDLYTNLDKQVAAKDVTLQQEMIAERRNQTLEEMEEEAYGWEITSFIAGLMVVVSWIMGIGALVYPYVVQANLPSKGQSPSFIIFIATIMVLLVATILTIWAKVKTVYKLVTRLLFLLYLIIFILVALKSAGIITDTIPILDVLLGKLQF